AGVSSLSDRYRAASGGDADAGTGAFRLRIRRGPCFGPAGELSSRGEYVPVDVPGAGVAGIDPGDGRAGGGDAAEHSRAAAGAGAAAGDRVSGERPGRDGAVGEPVSVGLGTGDRSGV